MFQVIYNKKTGRILRRGWFADDAPLAKTEARLAFEQSVDIHEMAVDVKKKALVRATPDTAFVFVETDESKWSRVRMERTSRLAQTDFLLVTDYPISEANRAKVSAYRQKLRDITRAFADPDEVVWPVLEEFDDSSS